MKTITGTIVAMNKRTLSVEYQPTPEETYELLLPYDDTVTLERVRAMQELKPGDTIQVTFRQVYRPREDGEPMLMKTTTTAVALVKTGSAQALSAQGGQAR